MRVFDIVIIGAATTGAYFGRLMAEKGFSTLVIDSLAEKDIGARQSCISNKVESQLLCLEIMIILHHMNTI